MMLLLRRLLWSAALILLGGAAACGHSRTVEKLDGDDRGVTADARGMPEAPVDPEHPLVVDAPEKLLRPGAGDRIQNALREEGVLTQSGERALAETTADAIQRFQADRDLAATGFPDAETLKLLGLDPSEIYRSAPGEAETARLRRKQSSEARERAAGEEEPEEETGEAKAEERQ